MPWPLSQDYNEALQNPQTSFSDPELRQGQVVVNALGIPQPCSGNFADVYAVACAAGQTKWAVKCFTREVHGLRERYSEISKHLQQVRLPFTVDFQYLEQGIRLAGRWYPILKMHWVEGATLNAFVRNMLDKPAMLEKLSRVWVRMAHRLREAKLTHCDLQHGNVLLVPDSEAQALAVRLIDYDGMWVPALAKSPSGEFGHPAYQHPRRLRESAYNAEVDRFPLLAVHIALRSLIAGGRQLWERYDTGDNLLFRQSDFETPAKSPLFAELLRMNQPEVRDLVVKLIDSARTALEQTPHLADLVADERPSKSSGIRSQSPRPSPIRTTAAITQQPSAQASDASPFQEIEAAEARGDKAGSLVPWIVAGSVAACAVGGGVFLWGLKAGGGSEKPSTKPALVQATNPISAPEPKPTPKETTKPNDPPRPFPKPSDVPLKQALARVPILDGPPGEVRHFEGHTSEVIAVAFSPDGKRALSAGSDKSVCLWDVASGKQIYSLNGHTQMVWSVAFSPDGKRAVSAAYDNTVRVWDLNTGELIQVFSRHGNPVRRAVFLPDGKHVLSAGWDRMVRLWNVENAREIRTYQGNQSNIYWMAMSPDGKRVLSTGGDRDIHCWETGSGRELQPYKGNTGDVYAIAFSSDGQFVAASGADQVVRIWRTSDSAVPLHDLKGHTGPVNAVAFTPDGLRLLSASHDGTVRLWDVSTGIELGRFYGPDGHKMLSVSVSPDGRYFLSGGSDHTMRLWRLPPPDVLAAKPDAPAVEVKRYTGHTANVRQVAFSFDGRYILSAGYDNTARLWETATGREVLAFPRHSHSDVTTIAFLPDGRRAVSGGADRVIRLWDLRDGREIRALKGAEGSVFNLAVSPDGRRAASCGQETFVRLWDLESGEEIRQLKGVGHHGDRVCFSPGGGRVLVGYDQGSLCLLDATSGRVIQQFQGHTDAVTGIGFSPDGRQVFSASRDKTLRLWDPVSGKELRRYEGNTDQLEGAALSPDGRRIVAAGKDRVIRLWDVQTGAKLAEFNGPDRVWDVAYSPDGHYAVSAGDDKTLRLWRLPFAPFEIGRPLQIKAEVEVVEKKPPAPVTKPVPIPGAGKLPVPDEAMRKKATEDIRDIYKADYSSLRQADDRVALAVKLLKRGTNKGEDPSRRFAYLSEARDLAARGGDAAVTISAIDELTKLFAVEPLSMKTAALELAVKALQSPDPAKKLLGQVLALADEAESADDYEHASKLLKIAQSAAYKAGDSVSRGVVAQRDNRLKSLRAEYAKIADALKSLAERPDDGAANLTVGKFQCFIKEDWSKGLPMLVRSQDADLVELAKKEMENPQRADDQAGLGQAWGTFADKQVNANIRKAARQRARHWLRAALPYLTGAYADRVASQLELKVARLKLRPGLVAELFGDEKFEKGIRARLDYKVEYNWGNGSPGGKVPADHFAIRWQGWLVPPRAGKYKLIVTHDDGIRLILDGKTLIDKWGQVGDPSTVEIVLTNHPHALQLDFHEIVGDSRIHLQWSLEGGFKEQTVPLDALYHEVKQERLLAP